MRFKAKLAPEQLSMFYQLLAPLSRVAGTSSDAGQSVWTRSGSQLILDNNVVLISTKGKSSENDNVRCFAQLQAAGGIFFEHRIESAADNNTIVMEVDLVQLRLALQSIVAESKDLALDQNHTVIKLNKRQNIPCLCLSANGGSVDVQHSIPVRILRASERANFQPPQLEMTNVTLELNQQPLRPIIEGLKSLSPFLYLTGTNKGELTITVDSDGASIRTFLNHLTPTNCQSEECTVKVDTKKLLASLQWQGTCSVWVSSTVLCLVENEMLVVHAKLHPSSVGFFTFYVPVHYLPQDMTEE